MHFIFVRHINQPRKSSPIGSDISFPSRSRRFIPNSGKCVRAAKHPVPRIRVDCVNSAEKKRRGTERSVPRSLSVRPGRSVVVVVAPFARPATAAGCFATLSSRNSGLFAREFVRGSFLVGGAPTFRRDCSLRLRIHRRESAGSLATHTASTACLRSALSSRPADRSTASASHSAAAHASFVHPVPFVVGLVCHYQSPAANFRVCQAGLLDVHRASGGLAGAVAASE